MGLTVRDRTAAHQGRGLGIGAPGAEAVLFAPGHVSEWERKTDHVRGRT
jgi:hypothetical protein